MQRLTVKHQTESCRRVGDRSEKVGRVKDTPRRLTEIIHLAPWGLTEPGPPTKEHAWTGPRPSHICSKCAVWSSCVSPNKRSRDCLHLCSFTLDPLPPHGLPGWASVEENVPSPAGTRCPRVGRYPRGGSPFFDDKGRR